MSDDIDSISSKLPDIYFDWYARLLPGIVGEVALLRHASEATRDYALNHWGLLLLVAYLLGHLIQPASEFLVCVGEDRCGGKEAYASHKRAKERNQDLLRKVSKAHAEAVSMLSSGLLVFAAAVIHFAKHGAIDAVLLACTALLPIFALERIYARSTKIEDLGPVN